jgi:phage/plasmid-associated DNA primase
MNSLKHASKNNPCLHCGKTDWCYTLINGATCCKRGNIADSWLDSGKKDKQGDSILYPAHWEGKPPEPKVIDTQTWIYADRNGNPLIKVIRQNLDNGKKRIYQLSRVGNSWLKTRPDSIAREDIPIYRFKEIQEAIEQEKPIFICEGEKCADSLLELGLEATTNLGGCKGFSQSDVNDLMTPGAKIILVPDRDKVGMELMEKWAKFFPLAQWVYSFPESTFWQNLPPDNGLDVADWIEEKKLTADDILEAIESRREIPKEAVAKIFQQAELPFTEQALQDLYPEGFYAGIKGELYKFNGQFYKKLEKEIEYRRIREWAKEHAEYVRGRWVLANLSKERVNAIWEWVVMSNAVSTTEVDQPGLNLANGTLKLHWKEKTVSWEFIPHSPKIIYTRCSEVIYDPSADPENCDRLLSCLDHDQQAIFLRTIAASLDLQEIRKRQGRIRAILAEGKGLNGKDSLREAIRLIFDNGMINTTISDFKTYDQGRQFPLAKLENAMISWSSENSSLSNIDRIESLKAAITGNPINIERKNQEERPFKPQTVFFFNINGFPGLTGGLDAILSRWCVLSFRKTFKKDADLSKGELEVDPRFADDQNFLINQVCPALLNKILSELQLLASEGINYSQTRDAFEEIQEATNHLWSFCHETGIKADPNGRVFVNELWDLLRQWYEDNGTLELKKLDDGKIKEIFHEQANKYDLNVKALNQVFKRFSALFPHIKRFRETVGDRKGQAFIQGICIDFASLPHYPYTEGDTASPLASLCLTLASPEKKEERKEANGRTTENKASEANGHRSEANGEASGEATTTVYQPSEAVRQKKSKKSTGFTRGERLESIRIECDLLGLSVEQLKSLCVQEFGRGDSVDLTDQEIHQLLNILRVESNTRFIQGRLG